MWDVHSWFYYLGIVLYVGRADYTWYDWLWHHLGFGLDFNLSCDCGMSCQGCVQLCCVYDFFQGCSCLCHMKYNHVLISSWSNRYQLIRVLHAWILPVNGDIILSSIDNVNHQSIPVVYFQCRSRELSIHSYNVVSFAQPLHCCCLNLFQEKLLWVLEFSIIKETSFL